MVRPGSKSGSIGETGTSRGPRGGATGKRQASIPPTSTVRSGGGLALFIDAQDACLMPEILKRGLSGGDRGESIVGLDAQAGRRQCSSPSAGGGLRTLSGESLVARDRPRGLTIGAYGAAKKRSESPGCWPTREMRDRRRRVTGPNSAGGTRSGVYRDGPDRDSRTERFGRGRGAD